MRIEREIERHGGLAATHELLRVGANRHTLAAAVHRGEIIRVRQGWYAMPHTDEDLVRAVRVGGRMTCVSAAQKVGLQVLQPSQLHVAVGRTSARLRRPDDKNRRLATHPDATVSVHWTDTFHGGNRFRTSLIDSLAHMALCQPVELVVAAADSALNLRYISRRNWGELSRRLPACVAVLLENVDPAAQSITESVFRFRMHALGVELRTQVWIDGVGRVDFTVGRRLVVEVDGWAYHADRDRFENDRRRDALLSVLGFRVLRFSYNQVMNQWASVRGAVLAAIARGDHL